MSIQYNKSKQEQKPNLSDVFAIHGLRSEPRR